MSLTPPVDRVQQENKPSNDTFSSEKKLSLDKAWEDKNNSANKRIPLGIIYENESNRNQINILMDSLMKSRMDEGIPVLAPLSSTCLVDARMRLESLRKVFSH